MLHIILVILKIAGILLAAVIGMILLTALLLLFVPLRYEFDLRCLEKKPFAKGRFTWFFHLVSFTFSYEQSKGPAFSVKLFGRSLFQKQKKAVKTKKKKQPKRVPEEPVKEEIKEPILENAKETPFQEEFDSKIKETEPEGGIEEETETAFSETERIPSEKKRSAAKRTAAFFQKLWKFIQNFFTEIRSLFRNFKQTMGNWLQKLRKWYERLDFYRSLWQEEETQLFKKALLDHIQYLIRHFKPRKAAGFLRYGTTDPALTGQITGLFYLFRPLDFSEVELLPDFETDAIVLEGRLSIKGHIRAVHALRVGLKLLFDKNLKHIRKQIRK